MPLVSFLVTCHNHANYVGEALRSILGQTAAEDYEIIVIDDASTDASDEAIRAVHDPRIQYIPHKDWKGSTFSINEGLTLAHGTYVARLDADDWHRPYFLSRTIPILERYPEVGLVYGDVAEINERGELVQDPWLGVRSRAVHGGHDFKGDEYLSLILENVVPACCLVRREALQQLLPIPLHLLFTDWYINLRVARVSELYYVAETLTDYRIHRANWHKAIELNPAYTRTVLWILDELFREPDHQPAKSQMRRRAYAGAYLKFADIAFGAAQMPQARSYYLNVIRYQPQYLFDPPLMRHLIATWLGYARYNNIKARALAKNQ